MGLQIYFSSNGALHFSSLTHVSFRRNPNTRNSSYVYWPTIAEHNKESRRNSEWEGPRSNDWKVILLHISFPFVRCQPWAIICKIRFSKTFWLAERLIECMDEHWSVTKRWMRIQRAFQDNVSGVPEVLRASSLCQWWHGCVTNKQCCYSYLFLNSSFLNFFWTKNWHL